MTWDGSTYSDPDVIVNKFADIFEAAYSSSAQSPFSPSPEIHFTQNIFSTLQLTSEQVQFEINAQNFNSGPGPDGIPSRFIKNCAPSLLTPLTILYNQSLKSGIFPDKWKLAYITPIPKGNSTKQVENYRPISGLCALSKILESLVLNVLRPLNKTFSIKQHGFLPGRSTTTNLTCLLSYIVDAFNEGSQVDAVYIDFKKAFDRIPHEILSYKLKYFGVDGPLHSWFESYLTGRSQIVRWAGHSSRVIKVSSGVPQGSKVGPWLFLIYIDDLVTALGDVFSLFFADDSKVCLKIRNKDDCHVLQRSLELLHAWCLRNMVEVNTEKCSVITYTRKKSPIITTYSIGQNPLKRVEAVKDLGVWMDSRLTFKGHLDYVCKKGVQILGFIRRNCRDLDDQKAIIAVFNALVRSRLEYASAVWRPSSAKGIERLEKIQRKFYVFF